ncbi:MAG TPA: hypothetical protein VF813_11735 [Anaerolineaceae bacterium]
MAEPADPLQDFWGEILSSQPERIRAAIAGLDPQTRAAVHSHLIAMANEDGWHPLQQASARAALVVFEQTGGTG